MENSDVDRAVGYVSYAFIEGLVIFCRKVDDGSLPILPPREFLTAPDQHIKEICVSGGNMDFGRPGVLEETICGRRFEEFRVHASSMPGKHAGHAGLCCYPGGAFRYYNFRIDLCELGRQHGTFVCLRLADQRRPPSSTWTNWLRKSGPFHVSLRFAEKREFRRDG